MCSKRAQQLHAAHLRSAAHTAGNAQVRAARPIASHRIASERHMGPSPPLPPSMHRLSKRLPRLDQGDAGAADDPWVTEPGLLWQRACAHEGMHVGGQRTFNATRMPLALCVPCK